MNTTVECADCGESMLVDEWALKRGAPVSCGRCIPNLRRERDALRSRAERAERALVGAREMADDFKRRCDEHATLQAAAERAREEAEAERDAARATNARLNRRVQEAESALKERLAQPTDPRGFGRILANAAATMAEHERDAALANLAAAREALRGFVQFHSGHVLPQELVRLMEQARAVLEGKP